MNCNTCGFYLKRDIDIRTSVIHNIRISKEYGAMVTCKHRHESGGECSVTDYNEYPADCPYKLELNGLMIISGHEYKPNIINYTNYSHNAINNNELAGEPDFIFDNGGRLMKGM